ncbi:flagellin [Pseudoroseicyclus aestuarii]|uniref:Flagellin n=1 Tax=Pseudoroseicyclus aestuarii TaxID=1795041 RepID=A0A318SVL3_9RHOB|nr:flagellin [Pseudoroseicyclus aestuarii]PYE84376.1 flagellar hook-associated protein 3 FlgL [Pseudoroseicyclus aestuarii]
MSSISGLSSTYIMRAQRDHVARLQGQLDRAAQEVATGLTADPYGDLGAGTAVSLELRAGQDRTLGLIGANTALAGRMEATALALSEMRDTITAVMSPAASASATKTVGAAQLQALAQGALEQVAAQLNGSYGGSHLFSGAASDRPAIDWDDAVLAAAAGAPPATEAGARQTAADIAALFTEEGFAAFYRGTPASEGPRSSAQIDEGVSLTYGVQADDPMMREALRGLSMLAAIDVSQIDDEEAYAAYMEEALSALSSGVSGLTQTETRLGTQQARLDRTIAVQQSRSDLYQQQVLSLEAVDPYEAATRVSELETRLQATYAVTARLSGLSLLNFL